MDEHIKKVSWLELFYDLAFVALVAQLTYTVADYHHTLTDLVTIGLVGYMIFIAWTGTTVNRNLEDDETTRDKVLILTQLLCAFLMSIALTAVFAGDFLWFVVGYVAVRAIQLGMMWVRYIEKPETAPKTKNVFWGMVIATGLMAIVPFVAAPFVYVLALVAIALDLLSPQTVGVGNKMVRLNIAHLQERLGLFLILVIGESMLVVALANTTVDEGLVRPAIVFSGVLLMITLWWSYFGFLERSGEGRRPSNMMLYVHAHAWLYGGVILLAAAYKNFLKHDYLVVTDLLLLTSGVLLVGVTSMVIRNTLEHKNTIRTGMMRAMIIGTPLIGYLGYQTGEVVSAVALMTAWVLVLVVYDEWRRQCLCKK